MISEQEQPYLWLDAIVNGESSLSCAADLTPLVKLPQNTSVLSNLVSLLKTVMKHNFNCWQEG